MTPELKKRLAARVGADETATEDDLLTQVDEACEAFVQDYATLKEKADAAVTLSAELRTELDAAKGKVLSLSAELPARPDTFTAQLFAETFDARAEAALEAGAPPAAVTYFSNLFKQQDGALNVLALSACKVPAKDNALKDQRLGIAVLDGLAKLAKGGFGEGVGTGFKPGTYGVAAMLSADPSKEDPQAEIQKAAKGYVAKHYPEPSAA